MGAADRHAVLDVRVGHGEHGVVRPLEALAVDVPPRAERARVLRALGALVDRAAHGPREGYLALRLVGLDEVLLDLGPDRLEDVAQVNEHREVLRQRRRRLLQVVQSDLPVAHRRAAR